MPVITPCFKSRPLDRLLPGLFVIACLPASQALADNECYWHTGGPAPLVNIRDIGTLYVPRDAPVGTVIGFTAPAVDTTNPGSLEARCSYRDLNGKTLEFHAVPSVPVHSAPLPPVEGDTTDGKVLQTSIEGVGAVIRLGFPLAFGGNAGINNQFFESSPAVVPYSAYRTPVSPTLGYIQINIVNNRTTLVKTGPIPPGPHVLNGSELFAGHVSDLGKVISFGLRGTVIQAQCSVNADPVSADPVVLGDWRAADFKGPGHTTTAVPFTLTLSDCDTDRRHTPVVMAHIRLDGIKGSQPVGPNNNGVFSLTSDSTAQGVGIQLLGADGVTPVALETEVPLTPVVPGDRHLPFSARFFQTDARVRPGLAKGALNFTMSYK